MNDESSESSVLDDMTTTPSIETDENSYGTQNLSLITSTILATTPKTVAISTSVKNSISSLGLKNTTTTPKTITVLANSSNVTFSPIKISTLNLNSTTTKSIPKSTSPTSTTSKSLMVQNATITSTTSIPTSTVSTKLPIRIKWITFTTPRSVVKTSTTPFKSKIQTIPTLAIKSTKSTTKKHIATSTIAPKSPATLKFSTRIATMKPTKSTRVTKIETTLNARVMTVSDNSGIPKISIIIAICVMLSALLFAWKYFSANKWNNFNSHQIEFKSNYPTEGTDESPISCSDSFQIDFVDDKTLIDSDRNDDADNGESNGDDVFNGNDEIANSGGDYDNVNEYSHNGHQFGKSKRISTKAKFLKSSNRSGSICDQYSEKRYLMTNTGDDEQFDFTPQTTL